MRRGFYKASVAQVPSDDDESADLWTAWASRERDIRY